MLLRFAAENILSFKDAVEFNTFPSSKSHSHDWHKKKIGNIDILRMSVIYGANGAGKSNLINCIMLLKTILSTDRLNNITLEGDLNFKLDKKDPESHSELAIEFNMEDDIFYYHVVFNKKEILKEELFLSGKKKDLTVFTRENGNVNVTYDFINIPEKKDAAKIFLDVLSRTIKPDMTAFYFLGHYYHNEFPMVSKALSWFNTVEIVLPQSKTNNLPFIMDHDPEFNALVNQLVPDFSTGITRLDVKTSEISEEESKNDPELANAIKLASEIPGVPVPLNRYNSKEISNVIFVNGKPVIKSLISFHKNIDGNEVEFDMDMESDGTRRLIEYMPLLYMIMKSDNTFLVDEIERSIHPILIKNIISKISESKEARGQLIFTTHESCLLDQAIFRPDEIWFAQKDVNQSTQLYPLSDYNIHKTANIENGYLNGRYGGIPFLANLNDLKW